MTEEQVQMTTDGPNSPSTVHIISPSTNVDDIPNEEGIEYPPGLIGKIEKWFKLRERKSYWITEIRAGFVTFVTMAYILSVNASILSDCGLSCPERGYKFDFEGIYHGFMLCINT